MVRAGLLMQLAIFMLLGSISGAAISTVIDYRVEQATQAEITRILISLPLVALTQIEVRKI